MVTGRSPESAKAYKRLQRKVKRYMELREELQVAGKIPVEPDGAARATCRPTGDERVPASAQGEQPLPHLIGQAVRNGWAVPEEKKPQLVDEMTGIIDDPEESNKVKVAAFNALRQADQSQWERDHPKEGETSKTPVTVNISVETIERREDIKLIEVQSGIGEQDHTGVPEAARLPEQ